MTINLQSFARLSALVDGEEEVVGSVERPFNLSITGLVFKNATSIANAANTVIYNNTLTTFKVGFIESDEDLRIVISDNNSATYSLWTRGTGLAGKYGLPLIIPKQNTSGSFLINTFTAFNTSGNTARVKITIFD